MRQWRKSQFCTVLNKYILKTYFLYWQYLSGLFCVSFLSSSMFSYPPIPSSHLLPSTLSFSISPSSPLLCFSLVAVWPTFSDCCSALPLCIVKTHSHTLWGSQSPSYLSTFPPPHTTTTLPVPGRQDSTSRTHSGCSLIGWAPESLHMYKSGHGEKIRREVWCSYFLCYCCHYSLWGR